MERHRLLWLWLQRETDFFMRPQRVLHFAPEFGVQRRLKRFGHLTYWCVDLGSSLADEHLDITRVPHPDGSWDVILCNHVLEHIPNDALAMRELYRVLAPGGMAIVMTPTAKPAVTATLEDPAIATPEQRLERYGQEDHVRLYSIGDFQSRLRSAGFVVESLRYLDVLEARERERYRLTRNHPIFDDDVIYVGVKPRSSSNSATT